MVNSVMLRCFIRGGRLCFPEFNPIEDVAKLREYIVHVHVLGRILRIRLLRGLRRSIPAFGEESAALGAAFATARLTVAAFRAEHQFFAALVAVIAVIGQVGFTFRALYHSSYLLNS